MLCRREDTAGIVDADRRIGRRMEDQQRLVKLGNTRGKILLGDVVEQGAADPEGSAGERYFDSALGFYFVDTLAEQAGNMGRIGWRGNGHDGTRFGDAMRSGEHRRAAEDDE